ncbi:hypothetical protein JHK85_006776 [Glycine max]|nr:hypothetical protein JHK85_006776 [Glycine max]
MYSVLYYFHEILFLCISFLSSILLGATAEVNETAKNFGDEKKNPSDEDDVAANGNKENPTNEAEQKEPENKEMTLKEYEKVLEERRKAFHTLKTEEKKGMGDFLDEMLTMMSQTKSNENGEESFEELQQLFEDMFQAYIGLDGGPSLASSDSSTSSSYMTYSESSS